jgi:hypothetical protein
MSNTDPLLDSDKEKFTSYQKFVKDSGAYRDKSDREYPPITKA